MSSADGEAASGEELFDRAAEYDAMLQRGLDLSGEDKHYFIRGRLADLAASLPAGFAPRRVLDFGCGIGDATTRLAELFPAARVVGVDTADEALAHAERVHGGERVGFARVAELAGLERFDLVYVNGVFHHIAPAERPRALAAIRDALVPGGRFALFENNPLNPGTRLVMRRIPFDRDAITLTPWETRRMLEGAGFEVAPARYLFFFPRPLAALRRLEPALLRLPLGAQYWVPAQKPEGRVG